MSQVKTESRIAPRSAGKNPATTKPGTMSVIAQKRSALRINEKSPNVMIVMGSVRMPSTGLMTAMITDHTSATRRIVVHPPATAIPGTSDTVRYTAATVPRNFRIVCISIGYRCQVTGFSGLTQSSISPLKSRGAFFLQQPKRGRVFILYQLLSEARCDLEETPQSLARGQRNFSPEKVRFPKGRTPPSAPLLPRFFVIQRHLSYRFFNFIRIFIQDFTEHFISYCTLFFLTIFIIVIHHSLRFYDLLLINTTIVPSPHQSAIQK